MRPAEAIRQASCVMQALSDGQLDSAERFPEPYERARVSLGH